MNPLGPVFSIGVHLVTLVAFVLKVEFVVPSPRERKVKLVKLVYCRNLISEQSNSRALVWLGKCV